MRSGFNFFQPLSQRAGGGEHVRAGKAPVGEHDAAVAAHVDCFLDDRGGLRRTHGDDGDGGTGGVLELQRLFEREEIVRVKLCGNAVTLERTGDGIDFDLRRAGNLLD